MSVKRCEPQNTKSFFNDLNENLLRRFHIAVASIAALSFIMMLPNLLFAEALDWKSCVREIGANNPEIRSNKLAVKAAEYNIWGARSAFLPQVSVVLNSSRAGTATLLNTAAGTPASTPTTTTNSAALNVSQNLFAGFVDVEKVNAAKSDLKIAEENLQATKSRIMQELKNAFVDLLYAQRMYQLTGVIMKRRNENMSMVEMRFRGGSENKGAQLLSKAYVSEAQFLRLQSQNGLKLAFAELKKVLGRDESEPIELVGELPSEATEGIPDFEKLALSTPDVRIARLQEEKKDAELGQARAAFFPNLKLEGSWKGEGSDWKTPDSWSAGLTLTIPLFNGGKDAFAVQAGRRNLLAATLNKESIQRQILVKLRQSWQAMQEAQEQRKVHQSYVEALTVRALIGRKKYNNGLLAFDAWDVIENDLINRQRDELKGMKDMWLAEAQWILAAGMSEPLLEENAL